MSVAKASDKLVKGGMACKVEDGTEQFRRFAVAAMKIMRAGDWTLLGSFYTQPPRDNQGRELRGLVVASRHHPPGLAGKVVATNACSGELRC